MPEFRNRFVIFPTAKLIEAEAYKAWGDAQYRTMSGEVDGILGLLSVDAFGQWVTTYYGPFFTWDGINVVEEPEDGPAMRADGVLADNWTRPVFVF